MRAWTTSTGGVPLEGLNEQDRPAQNSRSPAGNASGSAATVAKYVRSRVSTGSNPLPGRRIRVDCVYEGVSWVMLCRSGAYDAGTLYATWCGRGRGGLGILSCFSWRHTVRSVVSQEAHQ